MRSSVVVRIRITACAYASSASESAGRSYVSERLQARTGSARGAADPRAPGCESYTANIQVFRLDAPVEDARLCDPYE
jgi:hypothetical protein